MNRLIKFNQTKDSRVYFSSDFHLNHNPQWDNPIWKQRGFDCVLDMNNGIINSINNTVRVNDILWFLGDFCLNTTEELFESFISRINCQNIYMVWGNHNNPVNAIYTREVAKSIGSDDIEVYPFKYKNIIFVGDYQEISVDNQFIVLSHYPIYVFRKMNDSAWNLCGHSHGNCKFSNSNDMTSKVLDVGWDVHRKPLSTSEINKIMNMKNILRVDHHI